MSRDRPPTWTQLVDEFHAPVHAFARRLLGNAAEAEDATQDAFVRLLEGLPAYDPRRPLAPWVWRVAANAIRNRARRERVRTRGRVDADPDLGPDRKEDGVERREMEAAVQHALAEIDPDARAMLLLHYDLGLPKTDVAEALDLPRTTVQSRFGRALDDLRAALERGGCAAAAPLAAEILSQLPPIAPPPGLGSSLLALGAGAKATAGASTITLGVIAMNKSFVAGALLTALLAVGSAATFGIFDRTDAGGADADTRQAELRAENDALRAQVARLEGERQASLVGTGVDAPSHSNRGARGGEAGTDGTAQAAGGPNDGSSGDSSALAAARAEGSLSFERLAKLFAENLDMIVSSRETPGEEMDSKTQTKLFTVLSEFMKVTAEAHALTETPFFDARVMPPLVEAMYGEALGLDESSRVALLHSANAALGRQLESGDPAQELPLDLYARRLAIREEVARAVAGLVPTGQEDRLAGLEGVMDELLGGPRTVHRFGLNGDSRAGGVAASVTDAWREAYHLDERQTSLARDAAGRLQRRAEEILARHGLADRESTWSPEENPDVAAELLRAQREAESTFLGELTAQQREQLQGGTPLLLEFDSSDSSRMMTHMGPGI